MNAPPIALPPGATLQPGRGGLERLVVDTPACVGEIYLHGAHVTGWQPRGEAPVLWLSGHSAFEPGRPIRGGIPICFPWFGPHPTDASRPPHGFVRVTPWTLERVTREADTITAVLSLVVSADREPSWPHAAALHLEVCFGRELAVAFTVANRGTTACPVAEALHTYIAVGDIRQVTLEGLAGTAYVDKVRGGVRAVQDAAPLAFDGETDRPYLGTEAPVSVVDPAWKRRIVVAKEGSRTTVVWNPWIAKARAMPDFGDDEWPAMVCVEAANALDDAYTLAPGATHTLRTRLSVG